MRIFTAKSLLIFGFLSICIALAILTSFINIGDERDTVPSWLITSMYLYLVFVFLRTVFHLLFSFAWLLFLKRKTDDDLDYFPLVSLIVPCYQEEVVIDAALDSILKIDYPNFEVVVVDDGSLDNTFDKIKNYIDNSRLRLVFQNNSGKATALNTGIAQAKGEYVFCMDADSRLAPTVLRDGLVHFMRNPNLAAVAGNVRVGNSKSFIGSFQKLEYVTALNFLKVAQSFLEVVTVVPGPVGLFRKDRLLEVGGYNPETFAEDCDLTLKLLMAGYSVTYEPKMKAVTEAPENYMVLIKQRYRWSRGIVQAIKINSKWLFTPIKNFRNFFIILYMLIESVGIPTCNYLFATVAIYLALSSDSQLIIGYYFAQLVILDIVVIAYSLLADSFSARMLFLGLINRFTYGLALEIQRFFAIFDEIFGLPMTWETIERKGLK